jgi:predicted nuclease of restriction endonuclease-like (RecB) superfamily
MHDFNQLVESINTTHGHLQASAVHAVNQALTIRNWLVGYYIVEFEQNGEDRATYGNRLIENLAERLGHIKGIDQRSLFRFRLFFLRYPQLTSEIITRITASGILGTVSPVLKDLGKVGTTSPQLNNTPRTNSEVLLVPADKIINRLSYSHIELLLNIEETLKRTFYELESIKGIWSVRELRRQINSMLFERSGLSANPEKLASQIAQRIAPQAPKDIIRNIYAFDFLEIGSKEVVEETNLESALLDHLQQFIMELGNGFCLEARQKRILIGNSYYFVDLVFYHRLLKCHVLVELKLGEFTHADIGQLNTYLNFYKGEICEASDNAPIGILLVAEKDHALVRYATAGMDENLFVQKYMLQLPSEKKLKAYLEKELEILKA